MEELTCLYLALIEEAELAPTNSQPSPPQPLTSKRQYQPSEPSTVVDDDRNPLLALYPTLYF